MPPKETKVTKLEVKKTKAKGGEAAKVTKVTKLEVTKTKAKGGEAAEEEGCRRSPRLIENEKKIELENYKAEVDKKKGRTREERRR
jgi:hypothetical protein